MLIVALIALLALVVWFQYNKLVKLKNRASNAWADVEVLLKQRHDLIPNLVATVKGYMKHERELLERVTELRSAASSSINPQNEAELTRLLGAINVAVENYPELKANEEFLRLQKQLQEIEYTLREMRRYYNATVRDYNNAVEMFPGNLIAKTFGFKKLEFFELPEESEAEVPQVERLLKD